MNAKIRAQLAHRKRRIERRLDKTDLRGADRPMFTASNLRYEMAERSRGLAHGGIGAFHALARRFGLIDGIDDRLHLLKIHLPFHESDHVLNIAYDGTWGYHPLVLTLAETGEVRQERLDLRAILGVRMTDSVKPNEVLDLVDVALLGAVGKMLHARGPTNAIEEFHGSHPGCLSPENGAFPNQDQNRAKVQP